MLTHTGELDTWVCPMSHGLAMTLTESYGRLQEDEIGSLWQLARAAESVGQRHCPMCDRAMVAIDVGYDDDEVAEGRAGDGADLGSAWLDVCEPCQLIWFDAGELEHFPLDRPNAQPTEAELSAVERIRSDFGQRLVDEAHAVEAQALTERIYQRIARRPQVLRALEEVGTLGRR